MSILDRAKAHLAGQSAETILVPEWGEEGAPLEIHFTPMTVAQRKKIFRRENGMEPDSATVCVRALLEKACDKAGKKLFADVQDEHTLTYSVDAKVVARIAGAILNGLPKDDAEAEAAVDTAKNG